MSHQLYDTQWRAFVNLCDEQGFNPIHLTVGQVLDFLQQKSSSVQFNTELGFVTAISNRHALVRTMRKWISCLKCTKGVAMSLLPAWSLDLVLVALKKPPFEPIRNTSLNYFMRMTVCFAGHYVSV